VCDSNNPRQGIDEPRKVRRSNAPRS
jgi:hypothetical protein